MIKINNWSESFESADTRKRQRLGWFLSPTGCDSKGYRMLMREGQHGVIALGVFQALCQIMGTLSKDIRKSCILANSDGTGMEVADLWEITRIEVADLKTSLELLEKVKWLTIDVKEVKGESAGDVPPVCHSSAGGMPDNSGFVQGEGEEQEEGKGEVPPKSPKGDGVENPPVKKPKTFQPPTKEEFITYLVAEMPVINSEWTKDRTTRAAILQFDTYEGNDWKDGKNTPVKNWKMKVKNAMIHKKPWSFGEAKKKTVHSHF
tara:strand:- start:2785 stop:3570 length:786 start_codon:yes stop_codon:yes gene_type:complete